MAIVRSRLLTISYGPYVADYSRYLPKDTPSALPSVHIRWVFASAVWIMLLGAGIQAAFSAV